jgi:hypothetical protein
MGVFYEDWPHSTRLFATDLIGNDLLGNLFQVIGGAVKQNGVLAYRRNANLGILLWPRDWLGRAAGHVAAGENGLLSWVFHSHFGPREATS